jgi:glycosyltransferase involved in cell wall biosynthesis
MKVAILHGSNDNYGASKVLLDEIRVLEALGHEVTVIVPQAGPLGEMITRANLRASLEVNCKLMIIRKVRIFDMLHRPRISSTFLAYDYVVLWTLACALYIPFLRVANIPFYISIHEILERQVEKIIFGSLLRIRGVRGTTCSKGVHNWLKSIGVDTKNFVVTYPIFQEREISIHSHTKMRNGFAVIGRVNGAKGHREACFAIQDPRLRNMSLNLYLIGDSFKGQEKHFYELEALAMLDHRIRLLGYLENINFQEIGISAILSFPLKPEPFGLVPVEASIQGVRTYGYGNGGSSEVLTLVNGVEIRNSKESTKDIADAMILHLDSTDFYLTPKAKIYTTLSLENRMKQIRFILAGIPGVPHAQ